MRQIQLFVFSETRKLLFLVVYVGDFQLIGRKRSVIERMIKEFKKNFEIRVLDTVERFLGLSVEDYGSSIMVHRKDMMKRH